MLLTAGYIKMPMYVTHCRIQDAHVCYLLQDTSELRFGFSKFKGYRLHKIIFRAVTTERLTLPSFKNSISNKFVAELITSPSYSVNIQDIFPL
jgi:hypothetical protein